MANQLEIGKRGELLAYKNLKRKGYEILETNWRYRKAEIDLITRKDGILIFIEVKCRSSTRYGQPEDFVSEDQEARIIDAAQRYMEEINYDWEIRFDIISILIDKGGNYTLKHIKDAFFY